jgi:ATP-dependent exoDNAse (exonuclease V) beta subunit
MEHPRLHADLRRLIQLVFEVARETLTEYAAAKRQWGVIDFADQELLCLSLLDNPRVRDRLKNELDLVLVDEFQDTSPVELAIFTRLAELAGKSIWVGDQKQAIFGFRGTSPELMDAAVAEIAGAAGPESLATSYRSRPELVRLSSDVFGTAFAALGFEERLVRLEPASDSEPSGLGPVTEWWRWSKQDAGNKAMDARTLASGVRTLLADPTVRVRDLVTKAARAVRPSDVAVLCRTNSSAAQVAGSLEGLGVRALIPRPGLLATPEGQLLLSGVRLWVDPRDRLGLATVARLVGFPGDPDAWLAAALGPEGAAAFDGIRQVAALRAAANTRALAGPVEVIDIIVEALGVREECLAWGDASQRLANVEQVRAVSAAYVDESRAASGAATPAGLAAHLLDLAGAGEDMQAVVATDDAVTVSTWHQAKGLEWPVTVLFDLDFWRDAPPIGVSVASDAPRFDLRDPLRDRWIRLWPTPHYSNSKSEYHARVNDSAEAVAYRGMEEREALRVLYVGWTRARDRVVLAGRDGKHAVLAALADGAGTALVSPPAGGATVWAGRPVDCLVRNLTPAPPTVREPQPGVDFLPGGPVPHAPARAPASGVKAVGLVGLAGSPIALGPRFAVADGAPMELVGQALHGFLAADRQQPAGDGARLAMAALLLQRWGVGGAFRPEDAVEASDRLHGWVHSEWPAARWRREWPLYLRLASGTVVSGTADLLLELDDDRFVLIDHKTFPGAPDEAASRASEYAGQLGAYAAAIEAATGRHLVAAFIHMPVLGLVVAVTPLANQLDWHT